MYAVFETGGKQFRVSEGDTLLVEKLDAAVGETVTFEKVFLIEQDGSFRIGQPLVAGASVAATVVEHGKAKKIIVYKYKSKKNYRRKQGHRQPFTKIAITAIQA